MLFVWLQWHTSNVLSLNYIAKIFLSSFCISLLACLAFHKVLSAWAFHVNVLCYLSLQLNVFRFVKDTVVVLCGFIVNHISMQYRPIISRPLWMMSQRMSCNFSLAFRIMSSSYHGSLPQIISSRVCSQSIHTYIHT